MRKGIWLVVALSVSTGVLAGGARSWTFEYRSFKGEYHIYGGSLGDTTEPTQDSRKIAYNVEGRVARQMFEAMGPDLKDVCGAGDGQRIRQRANVVCQFGPDYGYVCNFGFDLVTGKSIEGSIC